MEGLHMKNTKYILISLLGFIIIIFSPVMGNDLANAFLFHIGGMDTTAYVAILDGFIGSWHIIGGFCSLFGIIGYFIDKKGQ